MKMWDLLLQVARVCKYVIMHPMRWDLYSVGYLVWIDGSERTDNFAVERLLLAGWRGNGALGEELHPLGRDLPALFPRVHRVLHLLPDLENKTRTIIHM
jgi:hypothetical protein